MIHHQSRLEIVSRGSYISSAENAVMVSRDIPDDTNKRHIVLAPAQHAVVAENVNDGDGFISLSEGAGGAQQDGGRGISHSLEVLLHPVHALGLHIPLGRLPRREHRPGVLDGRVNLATQLRPDPGQLGEVAVDGQAEVGVFGGFRVWRVNENETTDGQGVFRLLSSQMRDFKGQETSKGPAWLVLAIS